VDGLDGRGEALVLPEFAAVLDAVADEAAADRPPAETIVHEIVLECPVIVEVIGEEVSAAAAAAVATALLDGLAGVMRDA
jgi:hypothetical protein